MPAPFLSQPCSYYSADILWSGFLRCRGSYKGGPGLAGIGCLLLSMWSWKWPTVTLCSGPEARGQTEPWVLAKALQHLHLWPVTLPGRSLSTSLAFMHQVHWGRDFAGLFLPLCRRFRETLRKRITVGRYEGKGLFRSQKMVKAHKQGKPAMDKQVNVEKQKEQGVCQLHFPWDRSARAQTV